MPVATRIGWWYRAQSASPLVLTPMPSPSTFEFERMRRQVRERPFGFLDEGVIGGPPGAGRSWLPARLDRTASEDWTAPTRQGAVKIV